MTRSRGRPRRSVHRNITKREIKEMRSAKMARFICTRCGRLYRYRSTLSRHKAYKHGRFMCGCCLKRYNTKKGYKKHIRKTTLCDLYYSHVEVIDLTGSDSDSGEPNGMFLHTLALPCIIFNFNFL